MLSATVALTLVVVDVRAEASFDAPKRLVAMLGIAIALAALAFTRDARVRWTRPQRAIACCAGAALLFVVASAFLSPREAIALDATRTMFVFAALPLIVAADERAWRWIVHAMLIGAAANAVVSITQWLSIAQPFQYVTRGGRGNVSAMIGNTGVLGLVCAFAILLLVPRLSRGATGLWALVALLLVTLLVNRSITPFVVLAAGLLAYAPRVRARSLLAAAALLFTFAATDLDGVHRVDKFLSYRFGPWRAALAMTAERPLLGFGAGTYGAEFARHADGAFVNPGLAGSFAQAHNDYLQAMAELGIPATLLLLAAFVLLVRSARADVLTLSILLGGAVAALTWFPLQRPETALLLLAACGRAWRSA